MRTGAASGRRGCRGSRRRAAAGEASGCGVRGAGGLLAGRPSRSIFGARLRSRVPQYGHSVMYGLTSEPQFLQTTKRSGALGMADRFYDRREPARGAASSPRRRGRDDLGHDLAQVVVGLVDDAAGARRRCRAPAGPRCPSSSAAEPSSSACGRRRSSSRRASSRVATRSRERQVDELAVEAVARGQPLVLVEHLPRVVASARSPASKCSASSLTIAWISAASAERVLDARLAVAARGSRPCRSRGCGRTSYQR